MTTTRNQVRKMLTNMMRRNNIIANDPKQPDVINELARDILYLAKVLKYIESNGGGVGHEVEIKL